MNRHSLFFYIGIFYIFLACVVNWLFYSQITLQKRDIISQALENANDARRFFHQKYPKNAKIPPRGNFPPPKHKNFKNPTMPPHDKFSEKFMPTNPPKNRDFIKPPKPMGMDKNILDRLFSIEILEANDTDAQKYGKNLLIKPDIKVYSYNKWIYIYEYMPGGSIGATFRYKDKSRINQTIYTAIFTNLTILIFVILVTQKILPIRRLKKSIVKFSKGDLNVRSNIDGKDEIAEVSREFDNAIEKIQSLQNSRNLFLRNIMHELKTPIAKCKMITDLMNDEKNSERLKIVLDRFEYLLNEFAKIEKVTSNEITLDIKEYKNVDILDNALDILMIRGYEIEATCKELEKIRADFELFSIALKNLIDNGIKYGTDKPEIILEHRKISIISKGDEIKKLDFQKVFKRDFEDSQKGLGLGLYITYNIIKRHGFELKYFHKNNKNYFVVLY